MCGIVAMLELGGGRPASRPTLDAMALAIEHRGPDERGIWTAGPVGLAAQRLRIVDLAGGRQPLVSKDGSLRLVANGEIYNADDLREALRRRGHVFATQTDTEVILHAYEDDGPACLERLDGMFAFVLWDAPARRLFAARDRFGEKPLYYARLADRLLLASELKALLVHPDVSRELDWDALARYLTHEYVPAPHAIFRAVRKLLPAHYMMAGPDGSQTIRRYWAPPRRALAPPRHRRPLRRRWRRALLRLPDADGARGGRGVPPAPRAAPARRRARGEPAAAVARVPELRLRAPPLPAGRRAPGARAASPVDGWLLPRRRAQPRHGRGASRPRRPRPVRRCPRDARAAAPCHRDRH